MSTKILPKEWRVTIAKDDVPCLYGAIYTENSFELFLTDFEGVWTEKSQVPAIDKQAAGLGMKLDIGSRSKLLKNISDILYEKKCSSIHFVLDNPKKNRDVVELSISKNYKEERYMFYWDFSLKRLSDEETGEFMRKLNFQLFTNLQYCDFKEKQLIKEIENKDRTISYLKESYIEMCGTKAIDQYIEKNGKTILDRFQSDSWTKEVGEQYVAGNRYIWTLISDVVCNRLNWLFSNSYQEKKTDPPATKQESIGDFFDVSERILEESNIRQETIKQEDTPSTQETSAWEVTKKRFGFSRKRKLANQQNSPIKAPRLV